MRRTLALLALVLLASGHARVARGQQTPQVDGILRLLLRLEQLMQAGDPAPYMDLLSVVADRRLASESSRVLIGPGITRAVIRERDRAPLDGTLPGDGYRLMIELLAERGSRARIETWRLDIRRVPTETSDDEWRIAGQQSLTSVDGLHRLALNPARAWRAKGLVVPCDDLEIRVPERLGLHRRHGRGPHRRSARRRRRRHHVVPARARGRTRTGAHLRRARQH